MEADVLAWEEGSCGFYNVGDGLYRGCGDGWGAGDGRGDGWGSWGNGDGGYGGYTSTMIWRHT